jgi:hypothetical protein
MVPRKEHCGKEHVGGGVRMERTMHRLKLPSITPPMGPFPLEDRWGMQAAIVVLDRSMDPVLYEKMLQYESFGRTRSAVTNITQVGAGALGDVIGAYEKKRVWFSTVSTHSFGFATRFMVGLKKRHGEIKKQDWPILIAVLHAADKILEREWKTAKDGLIRKKCEEWGRGFLEVFA